MRWPMWVCSLAMAVTVLLGVDAGALPAQVEGVGLTPGAVVRVRPASPGRAPWIPGRLLQATTDSIHLYTSGRRPDTLHFAVADLRGIEMSFGRHRRAGRGAVVGGIVGGTIGLAGGLIASGCDDCYFEVGPTDVAIITVAWGAIGAGIGGLIGLVSHVEYWRPVPRASLAVEQAPRSGALNLGLKIPW